MADLKPSDPTKRRGIHAYDPFLTLYFPAFVFALGYSIATPAIPVFAKSFDKGFAVASLVIVMHALGGLIAAVPSGFLIDRIGRRPVLLIGPLLMALASILTALAGSFTQLLTYRFIGGAAMEMWRQARLAMVADVGKTRSTRPPDDRYDRYRRGRTADRSGVGRHAGGLEHPRAFCRPWCLVRAGDRAECLSYCASRRPTPKRKIPRAADSHLGSREIIAMMWERHYRGFFFAQFFASMTRGVLWGGTMLLYATFAYDVGPQALGGLATMSTIVGIPITLCCGYLMDRFGRKTTMVPGFALMAMGLFFLAAGAGWQWGFVYFIGGFLWVHCGQAVTAGSMQVLGSDMAPAHARGRFFGFWRLIGEIGGLVSPAVFGFVADHISYAAAFSMTAVFALTTAALLTFSVHETVGRDRG